MRWDKQLAQSANGCADCVALDAAQVDTPLEENVAIVAPFSGPRIAANPIIETACGVGAVSDDVDGVSADYIGVAVRFSVDATPLIEWMNDEILHN